MSHPARFVFAGDSITDCDRDRSDPASLGEGYVRLVADALAGGAAGFRDADVRDADVRDADVRNAGVSGDRAVDLEARWAADVVALRPDVLTVYVGVNDTWRRFDSGDPTSAEAFEATLLRLVAALPAPRPRLLFVEPFLLPVRAEQAGWLDDLAGKRAAVARVAAGSGATFVPIQERLTAAAAVDGAAAIAPDGVHPSPAGHAIIAAAWLEALGAAS